MPVCPTCGASLDAAVRFCPKDGTTLRADTMPPPATSASGELFPRDEVSRATRPLTPAKTKSGETGETGKNGGGKRDGEADDPLVGAVVDGRYRVKARLGQGGVGAVYEGEHVETRRPVAIKVLHAMFAGTEEFHKRFEREARAASRLTHPSCVSVIDFGRVERVEPIAVGQKLLGNPYLVMEYVRGKPLADRLDEGPMGASEAIVITRGVLSALKHAHGLGIVHRDIKPANIMLVDGGGTGLLVKLLDFGLAKVVGDSSEASSEPLTQAGMVFGTPGYLSPEQASGQQADARSDLYALGVVLYEMVAGRRPFLRQDPLDVVRDHLQTLPPPPRTYGAVVSDALEGVILKALAKDPKGRWQTAEAMSAALAGVPEMQPATGDRRPATGNGGVGTAETIAVTTSPRAILAPTGPTAAERAGALFAGKIGKLDRKTLAIGAGVLGVVAIVVVVLASSSSKPPAPEKAAAPVATSAPVAAPRGATSAEARRHLAVAEDYVRRLWCSDAVEELEKAARADEDILDDERVSDIAVLCLRERTRDKAMRFIFERLGARARPALEAAATSGPNADVRRGAQLALERLPR